MFKFNNRSVDGTSELEYESVEKFYNDWLQRAERNSSGEYVTGDGLSVLSPANEESQKALDDFFELKKIKETIYLKHMGLYHEQVLGLSQDDLISIIQNGSNRSQAGIDTKYGTLFVLSDEQYNQAAPGKAIMEEIGHKQGAMLIKDTLLANDPYTGLKYIIDTKREAGSFNDLSSRQVIKSAILHSQDEINHPDEYQGKFLEPTVAGDKQFINKKVKETLNYHHQEWGDSTHSSGFNNSPENLLSGGSVIHERGEVATLVEKNGGIETTQYFYPITRDLLLNLGSDSDTAYFTGEMQYLGDQDWHVETIEVKLGDFVQLDPTAWRKVEKVLSKEEVMERYRVMTKSEELEYQNSTPF